MEVILKEDVNKLGHRGDVVKVADGHAGEQGGDRADEGFGDPQVGG
jgi:hypothetical protein